MTFAVSYKLKQEPVAVENWTPFEIQDFSGGLCTSLPEAGIADNQFPALYNWLLNENGSLKVRGPYRPLDVASSKNSLFPDSAAPYTFKWLTLGTTDYCLASWNTGGACKVGVWDSTNQRWSLDAVPNYIKTGLTQNNPVQFFKFTINDKEDVLFCNGVEAPQRTYPVAGKLTASTNLGLSAPTASGTGTLTKVYNRGISTNGTYYYKFTYWYESASNTKYGESDGSSGTVSFAVTGLAATEYAQIDFTGLPTISGDVASVYVYRSPVDNSSGPYREVGFYSSGATFTDSTPEGEEGTELPLEAGTPPTKLKNVAVLRGRIYGVGSLNNKGVWSADGMPDVFPALNYAYFPDDLIGPIAFKENIYWFTTKEIYVTPEGDVDKYPKPIKICSKGSTSYRSIVDVGNGLVWQGEDNIYWADFNTQSDDGDFPIPVGYPIKDKIEEIPLNYRTYSAGCLHKNQYYLSNTGPNQTANNNTYIWNVKIGVQLLSQGKFGGWSQLGLAANDLQDFEGTLYTADNTNKYIMEHEFVGVEDFNTYASYPSSGVGIETQLKTKLLHFNQEWSDKIIKSLSLAGETTGITFSATLALDNLSRGLTINLGSGTYSTSASWLTWDEGMWGQKNWSGATYDFYSNHKKYPSNSKCRNAQLTLTSNDSQDTSLLLLKLYYRSLPPPI